MAGKRRRIPKYGTVEIKGHTYYRTTITDSEGKQRTLYAKTCEELYDKELDALSQLDDDRQRRKSPTVLKCFLQSNLPINRLHKKRNIFCPNLFCAWWIYL